MVVCSVCTELHSLCGNSNGGMSGVAIEDCVWAR